MKSAEVYWLISSFSILAATLVGSAGCSGVQVSSQKDPSVNLSQYRTYEWASVQAGAPAPNTLLDKQIRYSVATDLAKIGVLPAQPGSQSDFIIIYAAKSQNIVTSDAGVGVGVGVGVFPGVGVGVSAPVGSQTNVNQQSTIFLSFVDSRKRDEIWRGTATGPVEGSDQGAETLQDSVQKLVGDFKDDREKTG